ncbi:cache domain-containing sensor histidine kinase [Cohnella zeiphila]|uniref:histidine kinase n=1 Tax=Cohnella zeiphila TaxID=2761120 RepID=A0A7X0VVA9_9BACL|nr:sensor histidine kinase [Cohnella zeiphila]MBB6731949.1 sensor histidine kinase [Cohnella zeiphila]
MKLNSALRKAVNVNRNYYKNLLLRNKIAIIFSLLVTIMLIIQGNIFYSYSVRTVKNEIMNQAKQTVEQISLNIDTYFNFINTLTMNIAAMDTISEAVKNYDVNNPKWVDYNSYLKSILGQYPLTIQYVVDAIMVKDGFSITDKSSSVRKDFNFYKQPWFITDSSNRLKVSFSEPHLNNYYYNNSNEKYVISAIVPVRNWQESSKTQYGTLVFDIGIEKISNIFNEMNIRNSQTIYIIDSKGKIIANTNSKLINTDLQLPFLNEVLDNEKGSFVKNSNGGDLLVNYSTSPITGWKTLIITDMTELQHVSEKMGLTTAIIVIAGIFIAIYFSAFVSTRITKSISRLKNKMYEVSIGNYHVKVPVESNDEVGILSKYFNSMVDELKKLIDENYIVRIKQKEAEIHALQAQIQPHFLNNTLQLIHSMAVLGRNADIEKTIQMLSSLLDYVLFENEDFVSIKDEVRYLECFLQIQYGSNKRLNYSIQLDEALELHVMPKLLLQPLVENALIHGLSNRTSACVIEIEIKLENSFVTFRIHDNGKGMSPKELEHVYERMKKKDMNAKSIGLRNVYERIKLKYYEEGMLEIQTKEGEGTSILIKIPEKYMINAAARRLKDHEDTDRR